VNFDFSDFLLNYIQRFFLKISDIVSLVISLIAIFVGLVAVVISVQFPIQVSLMYVGLIVILIIIIPYFILREKLKVNNQKIFKIEDTIIQNYDYINSKSIDEKNCILEELRQVFTKKKDSERLLSLLSKPSKD